MGVVISCPACNQAREYKTVVPYSCVVCGAELPNTVREEATRALRRKRPVLITILAVFSSLFAAVGLLIGLAALLGSGPYTVNGHPASKGQFLSAAGPLLATAIPAAIVGYALWRERSWGRPFFIAFYAIMAMLCVWFPGDASLEAPGGAATAQQGAGVWAAIVPMVLIVGFFVWYFYRKWNVVAYYGELRAEGAQRTATT